MDDDRELLQGLLEYVIAVLHADHATFCEVRANPEKITVLAAAGALTHPEVLPGLGVLDSGEYGYDGPEEATPDDVVGIYRHGDPATPGVTAFLERIGAAFDVTIRVFQDDVRTHLLEVYFLNDSPFGEPEIAEAQRLAALLTIVITRDRLSAELARAEEQFRTLVEQIPAIPYIVDEDRSAVFLSAKLHRVLGLPSERAVRYEDWQHALHPGDRERVLSAFDLHMQTGEPFDQEYRLGATTGAVHWMHDRATLLPGGEGRPALSHGVMFDVTESHQADEALRESERQRQQVLEAMLHAEADARAQIAGELHDDTIQVMTAALLAVDRVSMAAGADERVVEALADAKKTLQRAVERTRRLTFELRPPLLEAQGLEPALHDLAAEVGREGGFGVHVSAPPGRFSFTVEDLAFRTIKEALSNARKHSSASVVDVRVAVARGRLEGSVTDDGRGFDVPRALDRSGMRLHLGLDSMRERLRLAGGDVDISSVPGSGARIAFWIPIGDGGLGEPDDTAGIMPAR
jgi:PAS domain S-box-containing protein